jgi:hypothetical protein
LKQKNLSVFDITGFFFRIRTQVMALVLCTSKKFNSSYICIGYSTIETKEADRIGYIGFLFLHSYSGDGLGAFFRMSTQVKAEVHSTKAIT